MNFSKRFMQTMLVVAGLLAASANTPVGLAVETTARGPNIDRLAAEGIDFHNAHAMAMCAPTRSQFKTCRAGKWLFGRMNPRERGIDESILFVNGYRLWDPHVVVYDSGGLYKKFNQPADLPTGRGDQMWAVNAVTAAADCQTVAVRKYLLHGSLSSVCSASLAILLT